MKEKPKVRMVAISPAKSMASTFVPIPEVHKIVTELILNDKECMPTVIDHELEVYAYHSKPKVVVSEGIAEIFFGFKIKLQDGYRLEFKLDKHFLEMGFVLVAYNEESNSVMLLNTSSDDRSTDWQNKMSVGRLHIVPKLFFDFAGR